MRVALDVTSCAKQQRGGIGNYGAFLIQALARVAPEHDYVLCLRPQRFLDRRRCDDLMPTQPRRLIVDPISALLLGKVDAFHGIGVRLPDTRAFGKSFMLHDLNVFEHPELARPDWRRKRGRRIRQTVSRADLVVVLSEQGARAAVEHLGLPRERLRVIPHGVDTTRFRPPTEEQVADLRGRLDLGQRPYVLTTGPFGPRKNQAGLLAALAAADLPDDWLLVMGGPRGEKADAARAAAQSVGWPLDRLRLPGWVAEDDLPTLLGGAGFYVCASMHEGFGMPVLEAQACGAPVVSSDRGALRETLGDVGLAFDPTDKSGFVAALRRMADDATLRASLSRRGPERVRDAFTWERCARDHLAVFEELAAR